MKRILFFIAFLPLFCFAQTSKTGVAILTPLENVVKKAGDSTNYPQYYRIKIYEYNILTQSLIVDKDKQPVSFAQYIKVNDTFQKKQVDSMISVAKREPVFLDGTLFKEKKINKLRRKGDVEVKEAFMVENWDPLSVARQKFEKLGMVNQNDSLVKVLQGKISDLQRQISSSQINNQSLIDQMKELQKNLIEAQEKEPKIDTKEKPKGVKPKNG